MATSASDYLFIIRESTPERYGPMSDDDRQAALERWNDWCDRLVAEGRLTLGHPLQEDGRQVAAERPTRPIDGPFAEAKEMIAGILVVTADDLDHASAIAESSPLLTFGQTIEVRPLATRLPPGALARVDDHARLSGGVEPELSRRAAAHGRQDSDCCAATWARSRCSCSSSSGVSASPKSSFSNTRRSSSTLSPGIGLGQRFAHSTASSIDRTCHNQKPATSSFASANGPSVTVRLSPEKCTRLPVEL